MSFIVSLFTGIFILIEKETRKNLPIYYLRLKNIIKIADFVSYF